MKKVDYYLFGLALLMLALVCLHIKGLFDNAIAEKTEIDHQISSAVCNTFERISTEEAYEMEVLDCAKLGNGSFTLIANANEDILDTMINQQLQLEDQVLYPYSITLIPSIPKNNLSQSKHESEDSFQTAIVNVDLPPLRNIILTGWGTEFLLILIIASMMIWILYNIIAVLKNYKSSGISPVVKIQIGKYSLDVMNQALSVNNKHRRITDMECRILAYLCHSKNQITRRDDILMALWGENDYFKGRSLDVFISRLRKHLSEDKNIKIETVHGVGFILIDN